MICLPPGPRCLSRRFTAVTVAVALLCTAGGLQRAAAQPALPAGVEALSLLGDTLRPWAIPADTRARYEEQLSAARAAHDWAPTDVDSIVWLGRRLAYLGRVREAIDIYTYGIAWHPTNPWLYRHRGHRYISLREFDRAISDLERAAALAESRPDEVEPDGQPNSRNTPIGTLHSNIDYHLALAYYLKGDFERALPLYRRELRRATNADRRVSISYWYYLALRRLDRNAEAASLLPGITRDLDVIENTTYRDLLLVFKGELPASLLDQAHEGETSVADATAAYGIAAWHLVNGDSVRAAALFRRIVTGGQWAAFGHIAAEVEVARAAAGPGATP